MAAPRHAYEDYFVFAFPLSAEAWDRYEVDALLPPALPGSGSDLAWEIRKLADRINTAPFRSGGGSTALPAETLLALRTLNQALRHVAGRYFRQDNPGSLQRGRQWAVQRLGADNVARLFDSFVELFPPAAVRVSGVARDAYLAAVDGPVSSRDRTTIEMLLLFLNVGNPAASAAGELFDDDLLRRRASFVPFVTGFEEYLDEFEAPGSEGVSLMHLLRAPLLASPDSLAGQIAYIRDHWGHLLPHEMLHLLQFALDVLKESDVARSGEPGPPPVLEFGSGAGTGPDAHAEPEAFSQDADWMSNVVLMAKSVHVWLDQLSRRHERAITRLDQIPDGELDRLARWGVSGLWLIGLWERSEASRRIKQYMGNPDAAASAYALKDYRIATELGGEDAWRDLSERASRRAIRLASDMVPNHMGIDSRWVIEHPEYFMQLDHPPYPAYSYTGGDLCDDPRAGVRIEEGYWNHSDAAVVFQRTDTASGETRYIYHGNDGTSMPWNDTAQLNFLLPEVREAVIQTILDVARRFPIIRFDAAMTLAKKHFQRLWFPAPGDAGAIPSRAEHGMSRAQFDAVMPTEFWREVVDRVAAEAPGTLLLAEAFWLMEGYFVRTLGMHRVYNSSFMNMLKMEDNTKYRQTIKNVLEFSPPVLQRFVNFMNNPDERTAVEQFGRGDKYFGCMLLLVTMPGLPMIGHGQIEGFSEKYGMEYRKAYWDEPVDHEMVSRHERQIFPLMRRRHLFSGAEHFALFDFENDGGWVDENVFAYVNRHGDERALIIYNNSYESTGGRIRRACAVNTGSAEHPRLEQRSLAEALALPVDDGLWHIFRDHMDGCQYLRSARELAEQGLHTDLHGYQARALVDWHTVRDEDGLWAQLAARLQGGGVGDLHLARRRLVLDADLAQVRAWFPPELMAWLESAVTEPGAGPAAAVTPPDAVPPLPEIPSPTRPNAVPSTAPGPAWLDDMPADLADLARALSTVGDHSLSSDAGAASHGDARDVLGALSGSRVPQAVYLAAVLRRVATPGSGIRITAADLPLVLEDMRDMLQAWCGHEFAAGRTVRLAQALAVGRDVPAKMGRGRVGWLPDVLRDEAAGDVTGLNTYADRTWLAREGLETLLQAFIVQGLVGPRPKPLPALLDARALILQAADTAGYDLALIEQKLGPAAP